MDWARDLYMKEAYRKKIRILISPGPRDEFLIRRALFWVLKSLDQQEKAAFAAKAPLFTLIPFDQPFIQGVQKIGHEELPTSLHSLVYDRIKDEEAKVLNFSLKVGESLDLN